MQTYLVQIVCSTWQHQTI